jgi:hypothetical protein
MHVEFLSYNLRKKNTEILKMILEKHMWKCGLDLSAQDKNLWQDPSKAAPP